MLQQCYQSVPAPPNPSHHFSHEQPHCLQLDFSQGAAQGWHLSVAIKAQPLAPSFATQHSPCPSAWHCPAPLLTRTAALGEKGKGKNPLWFGMRRRRGNAWWRSLSLISHCQTSSAVGAIEPLSWTYHYDFAVHLRSNQCIHPTSLCIFLAYERQAKSSLCSTSLSINCLHFALTKTILWQFGKMLIT